MVDVDISKRMIERSVERARGEGVGGRVEFVVADAQNLPFRDGVFDAVVGESIIAFVGDEQGAVSECVRVLKPGGCVGLNEATWVKTPPPTELVDYLPNPLSGGAEIPSSDSWVRLLEGSGLRDVAVRTCKVNVLSGCTSLIKRCGLKSKGIWYRSLSLYIRSPDYRKFIKEAGKMPRNAFECWGYGIYVGRK